jgi:hypothetical protein
MTTEEWRAISADSAPPGVYTPNMSAADARKWKATLTGRGDHRRVEIRKTVTSPEGTGRRHCAQLVCTVDEHGVRISANGTLDFEGPEFDNLVRAVQEAHDALSSGGAR